MIGNPFGLPDSPNRDVWRFTANATTSAGGFCTWIKPQGKSMCHIFCLGAGGNGGSGAVGANSAAGGGGGGGSGSQTSLLIPISFLPEKLYISVMDGGTPSAVTAVRISPDSLAAGNHVLVIGNPGSNGGNASGGTGGSAGGAAASPTASSMILGQSFNFTALGGQSGVAGGNAVAGAALTLPTTGLRVTGGTGGGGLPAAAAAGTNGGSFTVPAAPSPFPPHIGGIGSATATNPADNGSGGYQVSPIGLYFYGGTGGASTHGTATGGGLVASRGGSGGYGCGGGGGGGALTGSTTGGGGKGGGGLVIITCW